MLINLSGWRRNLGPRRKDSSQKRSRGQILYQMSDREGHGRINLTCNIIISNI